LQWGFGPGNKMSGRGPQIIVGGGLTDRREVVALLYNRDPGFKYRESHEESKGAVYVGQGKKNSPHKKRKWGNLSLRSVGRGKGKWNAPLSPVCQEGGFRRGEKGSGH